MKSRPDRSARSRRGAIGNIAGHMGEEAVIRHYQGLGHDLLASRWRGLGGEVDLIFRKDGIVVFVEVKASKTHAAAAERVSSAQIRRIFATASQFVGDLPDGQLTEMRFDAALVDATGRVAVIEAAFGTG